MQTLFAFQQVRTSDQQIVEEQVEEKIKELPEKPENHHELVNILRQQIGEDQEPANGMDETVSAAVKEYHQKVKVE